MSLYTDIDEIRQIVEKHGHWSLHKVMDDIFAFVKEKNIDGIGAFEKVLGELEILKDEYQNLETDYDDLNDDLTYSNNEKSHLDDEIFDLKQEITELQDKMGLCPKPQNKRS
jgi:predicted nuclease with TOPRIM domain